MAADPTEIRTISTLRAGDRVRLPGGDEVVVAYADHNGTGYLAWAGWPPGQVRIADVEPLHARTDEEHRTEVLGWLKAGGKQDHRDRMVRRLYVPGFAGWQDTRSRVHARIDAQARTAKLLWDEDNPEPVLNTGSGGGA